jgi:L-fuconolactonase
MLGSDWPSCLVAGSHSDVIDSVRYLVADLPTYEQDEIRGGTAVRVYRLDLGDAAGATRFE